MNQTFATQTATPSCLPGCGGHVDGQLHIGAERTITATSGPEHTEIYVSREFDEEIGAPAVRIQGATDAPMSPEQALQLAEALIGEAFAAARWVTR